jgi:hypothetical protein
VAAVVTRDDLDIVWIAGGSAAVVGAAALVFAYAVRRRSLRWSFAAVAVCGVLALVAGVVATAQAMFLSSHDLGVVLRVSVAAGLVSLAFSLLVARHALRATGQLREATQRLGETGAFVQPDEGPAELTAIAAQLAERLRAARARP